MSWSRVYITYDGSALRSGAMDVRELGPALLAIGDLCQSANSSLNGDRATVAVKLKAQDIKPGSFDFSIEVWQTIAVAQHAQELLNSATIATAKEILTYLGFGGGGTFGLIQLIKWLKGNKPKEVQPAGDSIAITTGDGSSVTVVRPVYNLYAERRTVIAAREVVAPLRHTGIDVFEVTRGRKTKEILAEVGAKELPYFESASESEEEDGTEISVLAVPETVNERVVQVVRPSFSGEYRWTISEGGGGGAIFQARLVDEDFKRRIAENQERFGQGDLLRIDLRSTTKVTAPGHLRTDHEIVKVREHIRHGARQLLLPEAED